MPGKGAAIQGSFYMKLLYSGEDRQLVGEPGRYGKPW